MSAIDHDDDEITELYRVLDHRSETITDLQYQLQRALDSASSIHQDNIHEEENQSIRHENIRHRQHIAKLEAEIAHSRTIAGESHQLQKEVNLQRSLIESLRKQLQDGKLQEEQHVTRYKRTSGEMYQLEKENMHMREMVQELEGNREDLASEVEWSAQDRQSLELKCEDQQCEVEELGILMEETSNLNRTLETENSLLLNKIQVLEKKEASWDKKMEDTLQVHEEEMSKLHKELDAIKRKYKLSTSRNSYVDGDDDHSVELEEMQLDLGIMSTRVQKYESENQQLQRDLDSAYLALQHAQVHQDISTQESIARDVRTADNHQRQNELTDEKEKMMQVTVDDLEIQVADLRGELDASNMRNSWYEEGQGLTEIVQSQKKLEADLRRRDVDIQKHIFDINRKNDQIALLERLSNTMKKRLKNVGHPIDEQELETLIKAEECGIQFQNQELVKQVEALEEERMDLLSRLRKNASVVGEDGMAFLGLDPEQLIAVVEFANNLKEDKVILPLDHRSLQLHEELKSLKIKRQSDLMTIDRLEREMEVLRAAKKEDANNTLGPELKEMLEGIEAQNKTLVESLAKSKIQSSNTLKCTTDHDELALRSKLCTILDHDGMYDGTTFYQQVGSLMEKYDKQQKELYTLKDVLALQSNEIEEDQETRNSSGPEISKYQGEIVRLKAMIVNMKKPKIITTATHPPLMKNAQVQVGDNCEITSNQLSISRLGRELKLSRQELTSCQCKLTLAESKISRLQSAATTKHTNRLELAAAAVKELKSCLESKNKLLAKFRARELQTISYKERGDDRTFADMESREMVDKRNDRHQAEMHNVRAQVEAIAKQLERTNYLLNESENSLLKTKSILQGEQERCRKMEVQYHEMLDVIRKLKEESTKVNQDNNKLNELGKVWQEDRSNLIATIGNLKYQLKEKEERNTTLTSSLTKRVSVIHDKNEEIAELSKLEEEVKRLKSSLDVSRSRLRLSRGQSEKSLAEFHKETGDIKAEVTRRQSECSRFRKEICDLKEEKKALHNRSHKQEIKIQELKELTEESDHGASTRRYKDKENELSMKILALKTDNSRLRGLVASYKLKAGINKLTDNLSGDSGSSKSLKKGGSTKINDHDPMKVEYERKISNLSQQVELLSKDHKPTDSIIVYEKEIKELKNENKSLRREVEKVKNIRLENEMKTEEIKELQMKLEGVQRSSSLQDVREQTKVSRLSEQVKALQAKLKTAEAEQEKSPSYQIIKEENEKLREELGAFDMDFFDELEELKFKYSEAEKKLEAYGIP